MKKIVLMAFLIVSLYSNAQIEIGARGGINISDIVGKDVDYKAKAGIHIGGFIQVPLADKLTLQPELLYSSQGGKWYDEGSEKSVLGYLQIPVLVKYTTSFGVFAETGPHISFLMSAKDKYDGKSVDVKEYLKKTDIGWQFGLGYQINRNIGANVRYSASFTNFYEDDDDITWKEKNSVMQVGVYYMFNRKSK